MNKFVALVPMKAHSERVRNKNIRDLHNKPLFYYILETLKKCSRISQVYVDTDSDIIKEMILSDFENVQIIDRPEYLIGDSVSMNEIIGYDLTQIDTDYFLQTHSTNPLLAVGSIENAIDLFINNKEYDSLFSVTRVLKRYYNSNVEPIHHDIDKLIKTQDLEPLFEENSCIYLFTKQSFEANKNRRIGKNPYMFEINKIESMDIDDEIDFKIVEKIMM